MKKNIFNKKYKEYDNWYIKNKYVYLSEVKAIKKVLPKKNKGLEIGVGTGRFASVLNIKYGIDPSKKMLEIAKERGIKVKLAKGEKLPYKNNFFDYILIVVSICFVKDPLKVLKESYRVLKKRGSIIVGIVDKKSFLGKYYMKKGSIFYEYAHFFDTKEMTSLLEKTSFKKFKYYQTIFDFPEKIKSIEKPEKGFSKGGFIIIKAEK